MSARRERLRGDLEAARQRVGASAEAVSYRTDVKNRAKDAVADGREWLVTTLAQSLGTVRETVGKAAENAQAGASELGERVRPHIDAATESVASAAHAVVDAASDAIDAGKEALAGESAPPSGTVTGA